MKDNTVRLALARALLFIMAVFTALQARPAAAVGEGAPPSIYVNLQDFPLYLKRGFNQQDTITPDVHDGSWLEKFPFSNLIISKLNLPGLPRRVFLSPFGKAEEEFTFIIPFTLHGVEKMVANGMPGLFLSGIGDNWEIYLNGTLVRAEMHVEKNSLRIWQHHSQRRVFFPLPVHLMLENGNILAFRIVGDPTDRTVGFQYSAPFYIAPYKDIVRKNNEILEMIFIGGYLLIAVYHFLLFAIRRKDIHNLFCGLFPALMGLYYLSRTHAVYHYIPDTALVVKIEFFCIFLVIPSLGAFVETLCSNKISKFTISYSTFCIFLAVSQFLLPRPYGSDTLVVWQVVSIAALLYILICDIIFVFIREIKEGRRHHALQGTKAPGVMHYLAETYAGNLLIAVGALVLSAIADICDSLLFHYSLNLTRYTLYLFVMTVTLMLARIYGKLNNALQAKRIFLANMSHEIRTPLNAIMGTTEQIAREQPFEAVLSKVEVIRRAGGILSSIINDILDFSRLEAGKMEIVNREYRFRTLIDEVAGIIVMHLAGKDVEFVIQLEPTIPETLVGDSLRIRQILLNLLWNAVKFTDSGKIELLVKLKGAGVPLELVFTVSDTGKGIKRKDLKNIFTEFYQLDSKLHQNPEGTGLGLSICKNLCQLMGGEISVRSEYGKGSTFTVTLPQQPGSGLMAEEGGRRSTLLEQGIVFPEARALIVDDLESNRQVLIGLLKPYGMETHAAVNGREALERLATKEYDIIFMDQVMEEDLDGVATTAALRLIPGHAGTPVVALTANAMTGMREFFLEHGFQDYISKPIDPLLLDEVIAGWIPEEKRVSGVAGEYELRGISPVTRPEMAGAVQMELDLQRLDLLRHYYWHFVNGLPTDANYCHKFSVLLDAVMESPAFALIGATRSASEKLREEATVLARAGRQGDVEAIRSGLPGFYDAVSAVLQNTATSKDAAELGRNADFKSSQRSVRRWQDEQKGRELLLELKTTLEKDDTESADVIMAKLRDFSPHSLPRELRELYFLLYDMRMMGEKDKAIGALLLWAKIFEHEE